MITPLGKTIQDRIKTSHVNFPDLIRSLLESHFTGYLHVQGHLYSGFILFEEGKPINAYVFLAVHTFEGKPALESIVEKSRDANGLISVVALSKTLLHVYNRVIGTAPVHKKRLDTDFMDFVKLLRKLVKEGQSGLIELQFKDGWADVLFFYHEGKVIHFQIIDRNQQPMRVDIDLKSLAEMVEAKGGYLTVYRARTPEPLVLKEETTSLLKRVLEDIYVELSTVKGFSSDQNRVTVDKGIMTQWIHEGLINPNKPNALVEKDGASFEVSVASEPGLAGMIVLPAQLLGKLSVKQGKRVRLQPLKGA